MMDNSNKTISERIYWYGNVVAFSEKLNAIISDIVTVADDFSDISNSSDISNVPIEFRFGTFERPASMSHNQLNIVLDHYYEFNKETDIIAFIDHHLVEVVKITDYKSNAYMLYTNYKVIYNILRPIISLCANRVSAIVVWFHEDLDGVASAIIMRKILNDIISGNIDTTYNNKLVLANILGNYGDIAPDAKNDLSKIVIPPSNQAAIDVYDKKISSFCKTFSRYLKATRNIRKYHDDVEKIRSYNSYISPSGVSFADIKEIENSICSWIANIKNVNLKTTYMLINYIAQNVTINKIVDFYNKESERIISTFINPEKGQSCAFELVVMVKTNTITVPYKLLFIDSPFDIGRSIIWKYRSSYAAATKAKNPRVSQWQYKVSDWKNIKNNSTDNIMCYNMNISKLSIDGSDGSAYTIAEALGGGGHKSTSDGRSIGSVKIDNINKFLDMCIIIDIL